MTHRHKLAISVTESLSSVHTCRVVCDSFLSRKLNLSRMQGKREADAGIHLSM